MKCARQGPPSLPFILPLPLPSIGIPHSHLWVVLVVKAVVAIGVRPLEDAAALHHLLCCGVGIKQTQQHTTFVWVGMRSAQQKVGLHAPKADIPRNVLLLLLIKAPMQCQPNDCSAGMKPCSVYVHTHMCVCVSFSLSPCVCPCRTWPQASMTNLSWLVGVLVLSLRLSSCVSANALASLRACSNQTHAEAKLDVDMLQVQRRQKRINSPTQICLHKQIKPNLYCPACCMPLCGNTSPLCPSPPQHQQPAIWWCSHLLAGLVVGIPALKVVHVALQAVLGVLAPPRLCVILAHLFGRLIPDRSAGRQAGRNSAVADHNGDNTYAMPPLGLPATMCCVGYTQLEIMPHQTVHAVLCAESG